MDITPQQTTHETIKSPPTETWSFTSKTILASIKKDQTIITDLEKSSTVIYEFDKLEDLYTLSYDMSKEEIYITVNPNYHIEDNYTLKNFRTSNGGFDFDLYVGNILAEEEITLYNPALVTNSTPGIPCPFCALIAAAADNINKIIGAVREHRRLSTCEISMQACIDQGGVPLVIVDKDGGCTVSKCQKDGSE